MKLFEEINCKDINKNPIKAFDDDWALLTAGNEGGWNTMTVSWGGIGKLWYKDVVFVFVRPQRYTISFMQEHDFFTLSFFDGQYKKELGLCGAKSGRDIDKSKETGLLPYFVDNTTIIEQAEYALVCKKLYIQKIDPTLFLDTLIDKKVYPEKDYHTVFVGEIIKTLKRK